MTQRVLSFHYTLKNAEGKVLDSSQGQEPFPIMEGAQQIIPMLQEELFRMNAGEKKQVQVPAEKAYGSINEQLKVKVGRDQLPQGDIQVGTRFRSGENPQDPVFTVTEIQGEEIHMDGNHPLAGVDLTFDVEVVEIRDATAEEIEHGHPHGAGGHHH